MKKYKDLENEKKKYKIEKIGWIAGIMAVTAVLLYRLFFWLPSSDEGKIWIVLIAIAYIVWATRRIRQIRLLEREVEKDEVKRHYMEKEMQGEIYQLSEELRLEDEKEEKEKKE